MENGKNRVMLFFKKNSVGEYVYQSPIYCEKYNLSDYYNIPSGNYLGNRIFSSNVLTPEDLVKKNQSKKSTSISLKTDSKFKFSDEIFLMMPDEVEMYVYNKLKEELKREPTVAEILTTLVLYADRTGKNIDKIQKKAFGFYADTKGDLSEIDSDKEILYSVFKQPKPVEAKAEASVSNSMPTRIPTASEVRQKNNANKNQSNNNVNVSTSKNASLENNTNQNTSNQNSTFSKEDLIKIKKEIRKKVIGQDKAIDDIVNNIYFNQRIISLNNKDMLRSKANILMDGSTGTGKTFILEEVASMLSLPIVVTGATKYSSVGYKGDDITNILYKLLDKSDGNLELAERGIVAFDEFDKLGVSSDQDIAMRRAVQQELLTFISGSTFDVDYKGTTYSFDTSKLTFIGMGAFTNLRERKISENEKKYKSSIGFSSSNEDEIKREYSITKDDYINEGLERELVGRFSCLTYTNDLTVKDMERILTESLTNPLEALRTLGTICDCEVIVSPDLIHEIAKRAFETNTGARGLNEIVQSLKDVVANDLLNSVGKIEITTEHLDKTNSVHVRKYNAREVA